MGSLIGKGSRYGVVATTGREQLNDALARVAAGDQDALKWVYDQTAAKLFGVCLRILEDRGDAEDVLQEVYVTVWRRAGVYDPNRGLSPITWLSTLARNQAVDRLRARKSHLSRPLEMAAQIADPSPLAPERLAEAQGARRLAACFDTLDPVHASQLRAAFLDGQTYATLAQHAGVPLGTMKSWMRRALQRLRACLGE